MVPHEAELLAANEAFYQAFAGRNLQVMDALWARRVPVACVHPGWGALQGRTEVMASWRAILSNPEAEPIACVSARAYVLGEVAFVVCSEEIAGNELTATNVFTREDGAWRLVHHHAGPVLQRKQAQARPPSSALN
jgi:ketosteroid isomerase-like protein